MDRLIDLDEVIDRVTGRTESFFSGDVKKNEAELKEKIKGARILIIGGAGTIGTSFIKAILRQGKPASLVVVDINENGLTEMVRDIRSSSGLYVPEILMTYPINFNDPVFFKIFLSKKPFDIIANFAAHKHVRSEKDIFAVEAMLNNNVINAYRLLQLLKENPPKHFFCVSTDKAANPVNIMGASKKIMEMILFSFINDYKVSSARFANVAFSNGSLPLGFIERLMKGQPLSVPRNIKRFFVSPIESGELCMLACLIGNTGEVFFPKLDKDKDMYTFTDVAEKLLAVLGKTSLICKSEEEAKEHAMSMKGQHTTGYPVYYFDSDTTGEKPYEEFYTDAEIPILSKFDSIGIVKPGFTAGADSIIDKLESLFLNDHVEKGQIIAVLQDIIPVFAHYETGKYLDQRM